MVPYLQGTSKVYAIADFLHNRGVTLCTLKENLEMTKKRMKKQVDQHQPNCSFEEGEQVFLNLQHYKKNSLKYEGNQNLAPKFCDTYQIVQRIG